MSYSLVHPVKDKQGVEMHLLVQNVIRDITRPEQVQWFMYSAELIGRRFPLGADINNLKCCTNYVLQARNCVKHAQELEIKSLIIIELLESMAGYFEIIGQYDVAFVSYQQALEISDLNSGVDCVESAGAIMGIGNVRQFQGRYAEAISYYKRTLKIFEKTFGADDINTANTINKLGNTYDSQGKYDAAIAQHERALRIYEKAFGVDHINMANTINNLGRTYDSQGKYDEAIAQYERALRIKEKTFGVDHIKTADTINNLGSTYDSQGKYDEAIVQYERALRIYEKAFAWITSTRPTRSTTSEARTKECDESENQDNNEGTN